MFYESGEKEKENGQLGPEYDDVQYGNKVSESLIAATINSEAQAETTCFFR